MGAARDAAKSKSYSDEYVGLADLRRAEWRLDEAIALVTPVIDANVSAPPWVMPTVLLRRSNYRALLNDPAATDDARRVLNDATMSAFRKSAERQIAFIDERRRSNEAAVYAALIPGNRFAANHQWNEAKAAYNTTRRIPATGRCGIGSRFSTSSAATPERPPADSSRSSRARRECRDGLRHRPS